MIRDNRGAHYERGAGISPLPMKRDYYVYIVANRRHTVLYTGVTNDLRRRVWQHREGLGSAFTTRYRIGKLVYFEVLGDSYNAIAREKQLKAGSRKRKIELIEESNPGWRDLYEGL